MSIRDESIHFVDEARWWVFHITRAWMKKTVARLN